MAIYMHTLPTFVTNHKPQEPAETSSKESGRPFSLSSRMGLYHYSQLFVRQGVDPNIAGQSHDARSADRSTKNRQFLQVAAIIAWETPSADG